jgi:hypothetical protein
MHAGAESRVDSNLASGPMSDLGQKQTLRRSNAMSVIPPKADIQRCFPIRIDAGFHKPADIVTCPVLYNPMARAAAGDRSMSLPRTHGPRSLMRTVTHPLWQTRIWMPNGSLRWAAVIAAQFSRSPLAVLWPHSPSLRPQMLATSACAVATENSSTNAAIRLQQTNPFNAASPVQLPR